MTRNRKESRAAILAAAEQLLKRRGAAPTTIDAVSREAGCAKGLVNYHFKTKPALLAAVAQQLGAQRETAWAEALRAPSPEAAIELTWNLLAREARDGTIRAWTSLLAERDALTGQAVNEQMSRFGLSVSEATGGLLSELGLQPKVPITEVGWLLAAVIHGTGTQLDHGGDPKALEGAYAAAWVGVLALAGSR